MKIAQQISLSVISRRVSAAEVTDVVGLDPDRVSVRGSRNAAPPSPRNHVWSVVERRPGVQLDVQVSALLTRLRPHLEGLRRVAALRDVEVTLGAGRYINDDDGQEDVEGWYLEPDVLAVLASIPAGLSVDEYLFEPTVAQAALALPGRMQEKWWLRRSRWRRAWRRHGPR